MNPYPRLFEAFNSARTLVDVGIHHLDLLRGGKDLSAGGNCLIVTNCSRFLKMALNLDEGQGFIIHVGSRNNFCLAGWNLGSPCI